MGVIPDVVPQVDPDGHADEEERGPDAPAVPQRGFLDDLRLCKGGYAPRDTPGRY